MTNSKSILEGVCLRCFMQLFSYVDSTMQVG